MTPSLGGPPLNQTLYLDPGEPYQYVIPVENETGITVAPVAGLALSIAGRVLSVEYTGIPLTVDTTFHVDLTASNADGSISKGVSFTVKGGALVTIDPSFFAACISGSNNLRYRTTDDLPGSAQPLLGYLAIGSKIKARTRTHGSSVTGIDGATLWVVAINDALGFFQVSATSGGSPITPDQTSTYDFVIATAINTTPLFFAGDSSRFFVDQPFNAAYTDGVALPANFTGAKFVLEIVGAYYIKLAATKGGSVINSNADSFASDETVRVIADTTGGRQFPAIDSDPQIAIASGTPITPYVITADFDPASFAVFGLPAGLALVVDTISGTPVIAVGVTRFNVVLVAYYKGQASYRYLLLNIGAGVSLDPDFILDIGSRRLYATSGPAGRADRLEVALGDCPQLIGIEQNANDFTFPEGAKLRILVKTAVNGGTTLIDTEMTVPADAGTLLSIGEDWLAAGLTGLQFAAGYENLWAQYQWRFTSDPAGTYRKTTWFPLRVWANLAGGEVTTGPVSFIQTKPFTQISGNVPNVSLDSVLTLNLAVETWRAAVIISDGTRHESIWFLVAGTDATADGIQRPNDYAATTNEKVWVRVSGV